MPKSFERFEIESAVETLLRAKEIEGDSALMKKVKKKIAQKKKEVLSLEKEFGIEEE